VSETDQRLCVVCGSVADCSDSAVCNNCHAVFHLRLQQAGGGADCGEVRVNEQYLTLEYVCNVCLGRGAGPGHAEPPVAPGH
jgi:hypothetical protein